MVLGKGGYVFFLLHIKVFFGGCLWKILWIIVDNLLIEK